ncbi:MAG TPA: T9SS type A sorting domain-containing protein [Bacteroidetes bacterium]|nr:T9SS type A sorting domain-containing protein [Bacteroidota bacterium]
MKRTITFSLFAALLLLIMGNSFNKYDIESPCDAPLIGGGLTGAPGEGSCGQNGCHTGNINSGPATNILQINNGDNEYMPGETYPVTVSMSQENINKFGFQATVLRDSDNSFVGSFNLTDPANIRNINALGRKYVGTTACGSDAPFPDSISWQFEWTAPAADEGSVTLYLITIATNHNHSGSGDFVYTQSFQLNPLISSAKEAPALEKSLRVFPNPTTGSFQVDYILENRGEVAIHIFNLDGKELFQKQLGYKMPSKYQQRFDRHQLGLTPGVYFLKIKTDGGEAVRKITFL